MSQGDADLANTRALVVDGNPTSRSILVSQLREFGVGAVEQVTRSIDARKVLELKTFDIVLCEQYFQPGHPTGQDLVDDLRRNQLLPFSTVFIMVTAEATYAKVAEAAEAALDSYLVKPHTAARLAERLYVARQRKAALADIFAVIESGDYLQAAELCLQRFEAREPFWLYAARIGAELLMRIDRYNDAQRLYEAVIAAKTLPWARLGIARVQLDRGEPMRAISTLENLISDEPQYADAYDVLGRAQFELGNYDRTLDAYKMACAATPYSIYRLQNLGHMTYYSGDRAEARKILGQCTRLGLDSKGFDPQTLVLLAFTRLETSDRKGLQHCKEDFLKLMERDPENDRLVRLAATVDALHLIADRQFARAIDAVRMQAQHIHDREFNVEAAANLLALMAQLANKAIRLDDLEPTIDALGFRFSTGRSMSELLAGAVSVHPPYADRLRAAGAQVFKLSEAAMGVSLGGDPASAVRNLLRDGERTQNARLIETAHLVLQRYADTIQGASEFQASINIWRDRYGIPNLRPTLVTETRRAGGLLLRTEIKSDGSPASLFAELQKTATPSVPLPSTRPTDSPIDLFASSQAALLQAKRLPTDST
jgi:cytochrome c-type biogenesis protein CcmH/NrfG/AmiR/NasT family two-component response regulator